MEEIMRGMRDGQAIGLYSKVKESSLNLSIKSLCEKHQMNEESFMMWFTKKSPNEKGAAARSSLLSSLFSLYSSLFHLLSIKLLVRYSDQHFDQSSENNSQLNKRMKEMGKEMEEKMNKVSDEKMIKMFSLTWAGTSAKFCELSKISNDVFTQFINQTKKKCEISRRAIVHFTLFNILLPFFSIANIIRVDQQINSSVLDLAHSKTKLLLSCLNNS